MPKPALNLAPFSSAAPVSSTFLDVGWSVRSPIAAAVAAELPWNGFGSATASPHVILKGSNRRGFAVGTLSPSDRQRDVVAVKQEIIFRIEITSYSFRCYMTSGQALL